MSAGPTGATWEVWATRGGRELFGLWVKEGAMCMLLPVIVRGMGMSASKHSDRGWGCGGWCKALQHGPNLGGGFESEPRAA